MEQDTINHIVKVQNTNQKKRKIEILFAVFLIKQYTCIMRSENVFFPVDLWFPEDV